MYAAAGSDLVVALPYSGSLIARVDYRRKDSVGFLL